MGEGIFRRAVTRLRFKVQPALLHSPHVSSTHHAKAPAVVQIGGAIILQIAGGSTPSKCCAKQGDEAKSQ